MMTTRIEHEHAVHEVYDPRPTLRHTLARDGDRIVWVDELGKPVTTIKRGPVNWWVLIGIISVIAFGAPFVVWLIRTIVVAT